jgi:hypothetical protein
VTFSDRKVVDFVNERFVAAWESVAPVSVAVFDLGDGRQVRGAYGGNIALYLCDPEGRVLDILPALQTPRVTLERLVEVAAWWERLRGLEEDALERAVRERHAAETGIPVPMSAPTPEPEPLRAMVGKSYAIAEPRSAVPALARGAREWADPVRLHPPGDADPESISGWGRKALPSVEIPVRPAREEERTLVVVAGGLKSYMERIHPFLAASGPLRTPEECKRFVFEEVLGERLEGRTDVFVTDDPISNLVEWDR